MSPMVKFQDGGCQTSNNKISGWLSAPNTPILNCRVSFAFCIASVDFF